MTKYGNKSIKIWKRSYQKFLHRKRSINSTSELSHKFDTWLHGYFLEQFGQKEMNSSKKHTRQKRPNKALEHLRLRKKQCKAARKALIKAGLKGSLEEESISKTWHSLIRQHNKLRVALIKKESVKDHLTAEKSFRRDPHKFAAKLFNKTQKCGEPTFSAEAAQQYFEKTYGDEKRNHT